MKSAWSKILKTALIVAELILFLFLLILLLINHFSDDIGRSVFENINKKISGHVSFSSISIAPLKHFPDVALELKDLVLRENQLDKSDSSGNIIARFNHVYISVDVVELLSSNIKIPKVTIEDGYVNLAIYPDSTVNIEKAFDTLSVKKDKKTDTKLQLDLAIDELKISEIKIKAKNYVTGNGFNVTLNHCFSNIKLNKKKYICCYCY